jgi:hypothetical protein
VFDHTRHCRYDRTDGQRQAMQTWLSLPVSHMVHSRHTDRRRLCWVVELVRVVRYEHLVTRLRRIP